jgi:hypothetical protein
MACGMAKGMAKGMAAGESKGKTEEAERIVRRLMEGRFGPLPKWAASRLSAAGVNELEKMALKVMTAASVDEVVGSRGRNGRKPRPKRASAASSRSM